MKSLQGNLQEAEINPKEREKLRLVWGKMHQRKGAFNIGRDVDHIHIPIEYFFVYFQKATYPYCMLFVYF